MRLPSASPHAPPAQWQLDLAILILALAGFALNLLMLVRRLADADLGIAGCGGAGVCEEILTSPWSQIFGIPVTLFGLTVYSGLMVSLTPKGRWLLTPLLGAIAGAAVWLPRCIQCPIRRFRVASSTGSHSR